MSFLEIIQTSPWLPVLVGAGLVALAIVVFLARTRARTLATERKLAELGVSTSGLTQAQSEVLGQIKAMATTTATLQAALTGTLNERLDAVSGQMRQSLESTSLRTAESLGELRKHLDKIDEAQRNITELSGQVVNLQDLLANKQARGAFGEVQLNDIVRNILPPSAYDLQKTLGNGMRPDCLIRLPNPPGPIAVDAKFPLESFQALRQAQTDPERLVATRKFKADMQKHLRDIAGRYIVAGETAESAIMFIPSEAVYAEIHGSLADVVDESYRLRVWIVSPTTMWALLNTVRAVLKDVQMREQADVIQAQVGLLLQDASRLDDRVASLERHFGQTVDDVRKIRISTDKVLRRGERIGELQLEDGGAADTEESSELPFAPSGAGRSADRSDRSSKQITGNLRPPD
ncbi:MAG: DNA recombination protein RmuC [Alphaproteobacteria bacterium]